MKILLEYFVSCQSQLTKHLSLLLENTLTVQLLTAENANIAVNIIFQFLCLSFVIFLFNIKNRATYQTDYLTKLDFV